MGTGTVRGSAGSGAGAGSGSGSIHLHVVGLGGCGHGIARRGGGQRRLGGEGGGCGLTSRRRKAELFINRIQPSRRRSAVRARSYASGSGRARSRSAPCALRLAHHAFDLSRAEDEELLVLHLRPRKMRRSVPILGSVLVAGPTSRDWTGRRASATNGHLHAHTLRRDASSLSDWP